MSAKSPNKEVFLMSAVAEAATLLRSVAEPCPAGDSVKSAINRAAKRVAKFIPPHWSSRWLVGRAEDIWRQEARGVWAEEMDAIRCVARVAWPCSSHHGSGLTMITADVNADLFRIAYTCASTEETRYYLNGVHIEPAPDDGVLLVATDGHRLVCLQDRTGSVPGPIVVQLPKPVLTLCKSKKDQPRRLVIADKTARVEVEATTVGVHQGCIVDGTYPDWRRVVPVANGVGQAAFNPVYLSDFGRMGADLAKLAGVSSAMSFRSKGPSEPALIQWSCFRDGFGVLMPMRVEGWLFAPRKVPAYAKKRKAA